MIFGVNAPISFPFPTQLRKRGRQCKDQTNLSRMKFLKCRKIITDRQLFISTNPVFQNSLSFLISSCNPHFNFFLRKGMGYRLRDPIFTDGIERNKILILSCHLYTFSLSVQWKQHQYRYPT